MASNLHWDIPSHVSVEKSPNSLDVSSGDKGEEDNVSTPSKAVRGGRICLQRRFP